MLRPRLVRSALFLSAVAFLSLASKLRAAVVIEDTHITWGPSLILNYRATASQNIFGNDTSSYFLYYVDGMIGFNDNYNQRSDWYVVSPGQAFSTRTIEAGLFSPLITAKPGVHHPGVSLDASQTPLPDIFLGVATGNVYGDRDAFGWIQLRPIWSSPTSLRPTLTMIDNAMAYDSQGMIVGTSVAVPEPRAMILAAWGCTALLLRRAVALTNIASLRD